MAESYSLASYIETKPVHLEEVDRLLSNVAKPVIFDCGACEAEDSIRYARHYPDARIFALEPVPDNLEKAGKNLAGYNIQTVKLLPLALSDKEGQVKFHLSSGHPPALENSEEWDYGNKSSSLLEPQDVAKTHPWLRFERTIEVTTKRLDTLMEELDLKEIHFFHLDVQGAELMVLNGAGERIKDIRAIWLEVSKKKFYKGQAMQREVRRFLEASGFTCVLSDTDNWGGDELYIQKRFVKPQGIISRLKKSLGLS